MSDQRASSPSDPESLVNLSQLQEVTPPVLPGFRRLQCVVLVLALLWIVISLLISQRLIHAAQHKLLAESYAYGSSETAYIARTFEQQFNQAEQLAATLSLQENLIVSIVQMNQLSASLYALNPDERYALLVTSPYAQSANHYLTRLGTALSMSRIYLLDKNGFCVISSQWTDPHACLGGNYQMRDYYREAISDGKAMQFAVGKKISEPTFFFSSAIKFGDEFAGAAVARISSDALSRFFARDTGLSVVVDEYGMIVVSSNPDLLMHHLAGSFGSPPAPSLLTSIYAQENLHSLQLEKSYLDNTHFDLWRYDDKDNLMFSVQIADKDLHVVRFVPVVGLDDKTQTYWIMSFAVIVLGLMLIIFIERDLNFSAHRKAHLAALASANMSLNKTAQRLYELAISDSLTGLRNHHFFMRRLEEEIVHAHLLNTPLTFITMDIDYFKTINDTYGHPVGDEVIRSLADSCAGLVRACDIVGRLGGEEFAILLPNADLQNATEIAERIKCWCEEQRLKINNSEIRFTCSFGVALLMPGWDAKALLGAVDRALYSAKKQGRNCVVTAPECQTVLPKINT